MKFGGTIYLNGNRYCWKVRLPGSTKVQQIPLKPQGSFYATKDRNIADLVAGELWQESIQSDRRPKNYDGRLTTLVAMYHARNIAYYLPPSREAHDIKNAIFPLAKYFSTDKMADEFTPLDLKEFRNHIVESDKFDWCRKMINRRIGEITRMFKWAASEMLVSIYTLQALTTVEGLRRGRTTAREGKKIMPVPQADIDAVLEVVTPVLADMIRVQLLTGMRPGEMVKIRPCDIDRSGNIWIYRPAATTENEYAHKTEYLGHEKAIQIGPKAQSILSAYLLRLPNDYCFKPADSEAQSRERKHENRKTPLHYGNRPGTNNRDIRTFNECFSVDSYRRAITRACKKAEIEPWHPHQLRHTAATYIRKEFGLDAARVILGHKTMAMTDNYAELDREKAAEVAKIIG